MSDTQQPPQVSRDAIIEDGVSIGDRTKVWARVHLREGVTIGISCVIGSGCYIGENVTVGDFCKIQNGALIYSPAAIGNAVFIGPGAILTNDTFPRATALDGRLKSLEDWSPSAVLIEDGASIGAGAICVSPLTVGRFSMVGAGAVVTKDVEPFSLVVGVPARRVGWVGKFGMKLFERDGLLYCPVSGESYQEVHGKLEFLGSSLE